MSEPDLKETLRGIDFLNDFPDEHLERIASVAQFVEFQEGQIVFRQGEPAKDVFLITDGHVSLEFCAPGIGCRRIHTIGSGELLGWSPVLAQPRLTATARAMATTHAIKTSGSQILALCEHNPRFGYEFMRGAAWAVMAKRLNAVRMQYLDIYGAEEPAAGVE